jgi:hypothetical protein
MERMEQNDDLLELVRRQQLSLPQTAFQRAIEADNLPMYLYRFLCGSTNLNDID